VLQSLLLLLLLLIMTAMADSRRGRWTRRLSIRNSTNDENCQLTAIVSARDKVQILRHTSLWLSRSLDPMHDFFTRST